jgi:hypothetical protein
LALADEDLGRRFGIVTLKHRHRAEGPPVGVVGKAGGRGRVIQRIHLSVEVAVREFTGQSHVPLRLSCPWRLVPVGDDLGPVGDEDVAVVGPFVDGIVDSVEVGPPERLVLAPVKPSRCRDHRHGGLLGGAFLDAVACKLEQSAFEFVRGFGFPALGHWQRAARRDP